MVAAGCYATPAVSVGRQSRRARNARMPGRQASAPDSRWRRTVAAASRAGDSRLASRTVAAGRTCCARYPPYGRTGFHEVDRRVQRRIWSSARPESAGSPGRRLKVVSSGPLSRRSSATLGPGRTPLLSVAATATRLLCSFKITAVRTDHDHQMVDGCDGQQGKIRMQDSGVKISGERSATAARTAETAR
jgi:hypothetical protein